MNGWENVVNALGGFGRGLLWVVAILLVVLAAQAAFLILTRFYVSVRLTVDGLDAKGSVGISIFKLKPLGWTVHIFRKDGEWAYEIEGPLAKRLKAMIDKMLAKKEPELPEKEEEPKAPEAKPNKFMDKLLDGILSNVRLERAQLRGTIGIADDAMVCAMTCGTVMVFANALMAILCSRFINQRPPVVNIMPAFNQNKFVVDLRLQISVKVLDGLRRKK